MIKSPIPKNEAERLAAVKNLAILDTPPEERFDRLTRLATQLFNVPISTVTIMDADREWYKSCQGVDSREGPRTISFCGHALLTEDAILIVNDTKEDPRFSDNPMVVGPPYIRFYAGVPIFSRTGERVGVFCIKDTKPRSLNEGESFLLQMLALWAEVEVNIISLKNTLDKGGGKEQLKPIVDRLIQRNGFENLKSIKLGLKLKLGQQHANEAIASEQAIEAMEELFIKAQRAVE